VSAPAAVRHDPGVVLLLQLALLTAGVLLALLPLLSDLQDEDGSWVFWLVLALVTGPLAGAFFLLSRHARRRVARRHAA
jgi:hypothetical protein